MPRSALAIYLVISCRIIYLVHCDVRLSFILFFGVVTAVHNPQRAPIKWNSSTNTIKVDKKLLSDKSKTKKLPSLPFSLYDTFMHLSMLCPQGGAGL